MSFNPHSVLVASYEAQCRWCDGTGVRCRAAYLSLSHHPPHCQECNSGSIDWVLCGACQGTGRGKEEEVRRAAASGGAGTGSRLDAGGQEVES